MMKIVFSALCVALLLTVSGCVSYSYSGKKGASPSKDVAVFSDSGKIVHPYQVLGRAVVSGNYQHVSRDKMMAKLVEEAKKAVKAYYFDDIQYLGEGNVITEQFPSAGEMVNRNSMLILYSE